MHDNSPTSPVATERPPLREYPLYAEGMARIAAGQWQEAFKTFQMLHAVYPDEAEVKALFDETQMRATLAQFQPKHTSRVVKRPNLRAWAAVTLVALVLAEIRLGRTRAEAFEGMGKRTGVAEVMSFVLAITLADKLGVPIAKVLHIQAEQMRITRRQRAEELARQASIKMLFPLVFLIFPATFAVILGPAIPQLLETFSAF